MNDCQVQWRAIHARIMGLARAAEVFVQAQRIQSEDPFNIAWRVFRGQGREIVGSIESYLAANRDQLPPKAAAALARFFEPNGLAQLIRSDGVSGIDVLKAVVPSLVSVATETEFLLGDLEVVSRRLTERAFAHLQRLIVVDQDVAGNWHAAYGTGEPACEKLGAVHLLWFGIFAFKASATGARTDLVLGEPVDTASPIISASEALVLTEWKIVDDSVHTAMRAATAREQMKLYHAGLLHGFELRGYRYVVLVSRQALPGLEDVIEDGITYRHINISIQPMTPSKAAPHSAAGGAT